MFAAEVGVRENEFLEMTWREYSLIVSGYLKREAKMWRRTRSIMQMWSKKDLRFEMPILGDFEDLEPQRPQKELQEHFKKLGLDKVIGDRLKNEH